MIPLGAAVSAAQKVVYKQSAKDPTPEMRNHIGRRIVCTSFANKVTIICQDAFLAIAGGSADKPFRRRIVLMYPEVFI